MVSFKLALTCVLAPLLVTTIADASFAICAGARHTAQNTITMGFHLWNEDFKQSVNYGTVPRIYSTSMTLEDNGWKVTPTVTLSNIAGSPAGSMDKLKVSHEGFKVSKTFVDPVHVCGYLGGDRFRGLFFACYENGNQGWCNQHSPYLRSQCHTGLYMGADSVDCNRT
ncbi:hypothetical protein BGZ93_007135 [Podila epicladia]|nr:hypothetical protein BGZ92_001461 [Podila epicladia]KAG0094497.1 hypothetical protein BGZ93_007135 [Podila epicladia]